MHRFPRSLIVVTLLGLAAPAAAQTSWGLAVTAANDLVFCDVRRDRVWKFSRDGDLSVLLSETHCRGLATSPSGLIYGESVSAGTHFDASSGASRDHVLGVWRVGIAGTVSWLQPLTSLPDPAIWLVVDREGRSYGWNGALPESRYSQVVRHDPSGLTMPLAGSVWGPRDGLGLNAGFGRVAGLALAADGSLVVADSGNIRRVTPAGRVSTESLGTVSNPEVGLIGRPGLWDRTVGVAAGEDGSTVVVDSPAGRIVRVQRDGRAAEIWRSRWGWRPTGVALMPSGFYVMEDWAMPEIGADLLGSPRILLVQSDGSARRIVSVASWTVRLLALLIIVIGVSAARARRREAR